jgi:hypothetical protein
MSFDRVAREATRNLFLAVRNEVDDVAQAGKACRPLDS